MLSTLTKGRDMHVHLELIVSIISCAFGLLNIELCSCRAERTTHNQVVSSALLCPTQCDVMIVSPYSLVTGIISRHSASFARIPHAPVDQSESFRAPARLS